MTNPISEDVKIRQFEGSLDEEVDWDCGRIVSIFVVETPIGSYRYYQVPEHCEECDGDYDPADDHVGRWGVNGPFYDETSDISDRHYADTESDALQWIHRDVAARVRACIDD